MIHIKQKHSNIFLSDFFDYKVYMTWVIRKSALRPLRFFAELQITDGLSESERKTEPNTVVRTCLLWPTGMRSGYLFTSVSWISPKRSSCSGSFQKAAVEREWGFCFLAACQRYWVSCLKASAETQCLRWHIPHIYVKRYESWNFDLFEFRILAGWSHVRVVDIICNVFLAYKRFHRTRAKLN